MRYLQYMIWGMFFSLASSYAILTFIAVFHKDVMYSGAEMLEEFLIAIVLGWVIGLGTTIFHLEQIPFFAQLFLHFVYVTVCVLAAGKIGGWYVGPGSISISNVLFIEVIIYILVWLILHMMTKRDINEINERLRKKRGE